MTIVTTSFAKSFLKFLNVFRPHENAKPGFSNPSGLKSVFKSSVLATDLETF